MGYSTPYFIYVLVLLLIFALLNVKAVRNSLSNILTLIVALSFVIFFGCAGYVQIDCLNYLGLYEELPTWGNGILSFISESHFDSFYLMYLSIFKTIGLNYSSYEFINTIVDVCLLFCILRRYLPNHLYPIFLIVFMAYQGLEFEFNLQRNTKAIFLFLLSIPYIEQRRWQPFFILNTIGFLFHWSALCFFPLYFFIHKKLTRSSFFSILVISIVLAVISKTIILDLVNVFGKLLPESVGSNILKYISLERYNNATGLKLYDIERFVWAFIIGLSYNKLVSYNSKYVILLNLFCCYMLAFSLGKGMSIIESRIGMLFIPSYWVLIVSILHVEKTKVKILIVTILILLSISHIYLITKGDIFFEYDNYIFSEQMIPLETRLERY